MPRRFSLVERVIETTHKILPSIFPTLVLQWAGVETVIVDNDKKAHSKTVTDAWEKFGISVWLGAGQVKDRTRIAEFTGESADKLGGFPVNSPDCMVQNQSVNNTWKNLIGTLN